MIVGRLYGVGINPSQAYINGLRADRMNILLVSREKNIGLVMRSYLQGAGNQAVLVETLDEAHRQLQLTPFDAMLVNEDASDGTLIHSVEALHRARPGLPVIWLGELSGEEQMSEAGIVRALEKPFALPELQAVLAQLRPAPRQLGEAS
ncbi:MAG: hypothetical protein COS95_05205 [Ignavibacteriales bacterium CG07_land_8_20_14_0_80_59_12]|nr:MAG: hypothetical protein COS95_05205 [Ignavibacteriales bacterium CG07_land_8_20_14_0_80_59_12]